MTNELEVVMQANTNSYVGFGWKPRSKYTFLASPGYAKSQLFWPS